MDVTVQEYFRERYEFYKSCWYISFQNYRLPKITLSVDSYFIHTVEFSEFYCE